MTYLSAMPQTATSWEEICYPVDSVLLADMLPEYDIIATDRQQLIVGTPPGHRKTIFGIQSSGYTIIPNEMIRQAVDSLFTQYELQIKHTITGEFSISIILPEELPIGGEHLRRSIIVTNGYNGKTPFTIQGRTLTADNGLPGGSMYRAVCQNGLMGWADSFTELGHYQEWLRGHLPGTFKGQQKKSGSSGSLEALPQLRRPKGNRKIDLDALQQQLADLLSSVTQENLTLTAMVYEHFQKKSMTRKEENVLSSLPIPVQLARQARERLRIEQNLLGVTPSYWLMYNAVNYALFNARSSLTLNDRYKLDEKVFHQFAALAFN
ncbi:hypothetical protein J2Y45_002906 [Dyadobacter sp. BE34]|uniref:DUF932 domain-containing protein n=1 Tax=Dyadobacter fermentans TaxID=94254 RepID=A0ABU1QUG4_9BACT|nr:MULTISPECIES: hypothetical protein [Dyadobacter]MDR6804786.1 hypothetical protein [Dyadobacter fermentans]MDR7043455.1 hypothetical protein [Dyadobacter sp. BE242]MDR7197767.1 hypothetical protein [Dyadobacter sp. BE34]MDR7214800.1 hypothetical protein [Dyadobacter sp. BE31]MDR7262335.1 hypothetical protein [Dyadobacter sp. BE32]